MTEAVVDSTESVAKETGGDGDKEIGSKQANGSCKKSLPDSADGSLANLNLINPFVNSLAPQTQWEKIQVLPVEMLFINKCRRV